MSDAVDCLKKQDDILVKENITDMSAAQVKAKE